jgi:GTP pyrophosphokinase
VKWELEDLAFRYLQPAEYKHIAAALKVRRSERERYIEELKSLLRRAKLRAPASRRGSTGGRNTSTASGARCRPSSSPSSSSWTFAPRACWSTPSPNAMRRSAWCIRCGNSFPANSTTTSPRRRTTCTARSTRPSSGPAAAGRDPDPHARNAREFRTRRGGALALQGRRPRRSGLRAQDQPAALAARPARRSDTARDFLDRMRVDLFQDRVYVLSPKGEIVDVPVGGTPWISPIRCTRISAIARAAPRSTAAWCRSTTAEEQRDRRNHRRQVGAALARLAVPAIGLSREPATPQQGRAWFRKQNASQNKLEGRAMLDREIQRLGVNSPPMPELLAELKLEERRGLARGIGVGRGERRPGRGAIQRLLHARAPRAGPPAKARRPRRASRRSRFRASATCCRPMRAAASPCRPSRSSATSPWGAASAFTPSRARISRASRQAPARSCRSDWGHRGREFPVDIEVRLSTAAGWCAT